MTTTKDLPTWHQPSGIQTNGIGQRSESHLNLTRTMADVWGIKPEPKPEPVVVATTEPRPEPPPQPRMSRKVPYVGKEGPIRFRLVNEQGAYLHMSGASLTNDRAYAWEGLQHHYRKLRAVSPLAAQCKPVEVFQ